MVSKLSTLLCFNDSGNIILTESNKTLFCMTLYINPINPKVIKDIIKINFMWYLLLKEEVIFKKFIILINKFFILLFFT